MESKKSPKADLQNKKTLFFEIGLALSLLFVFVAFNWTTKEKQEAVLVAERSEIVEEEEQVPITESEPPPPPEVQQQIQIPETIDIVDDDIEIASDFDFSVTESENLIGDLKYVEKKQEEVKKEEVVEEVIPYAFVEKKPSFNGKDPKDAFPDWVENKCNYPEEARANGIQGSVRVALDVETDGTVTNVRVTNAGSVDPLLAEETLRVVKSSPKWEPGSQNGKKVKVPFTFSVNFVFQGR